MSGDVFVFGLSILTVVAVLVYLLTREGRDNNCDDRD